MGQTLFAPPNVKGWPGGRSWLNTSTMLERANFAEALTTGSLWTNPAVGPTAAAATPFLRLGEAAGNPIQLAAADSHEELAPPKAFDPARLVQEEGGGVGRLAPRAKGLALSASRPEDVVGALVDMYLPGGVRPEVRAKLAAFVAEGNPVGPALDRRVREAVHAILTMAEYQLA